MKRKIYLVQPTHRSSDGRLLQGRRMLTHSCAMPALAAAIPPSWEREICLEFFEDVNYDTDAPVVGISSMGYDILHGREIADAFHRRGKTVLLGGYQAHLSRDRLRPWADSIVYGNPGPEQMARVLGDVEAGALAPQYDVGVHIDFPFDYSSLVDRRLTFMPILTSVGCRNRCDFCCTAARYEGQYRLRSIAHVLGDLRRLRRHTHRFAIVDSNLYNNRGYLLALCEALQRERLGITWGAESTIDVGEDAECLRALRRAGCRLLFIGLETPNQRSLDSVHKPCPARAQARAVANIRRHGILVAGYFMVGLDGDTAETFDDLFDFIRTAGVNVPVVNILLPAPGTRVFERLRREGRLFAESEDDFLVNAVDYAASCSHCFYRPARMTAQQVEEMLIGLRRRLGSVRETIRRSLVPDLGLMATLLLLNTGFRRETRRMVLARAHGGGRRTDPTASAAPVG